MNLNPISLNRENTHRLATNFWASSPLKKPPGEGTGPTIHAVFRGNLVGRVPSRGERDVFQQTATQSDIIKGT
jgi:hypothetical protein